MRYATARVVGLTIGAVLLFLAGRVWAEDLPKTLTDTCSVSWTLPTEAVDGSPLTGPAALTEIHIMLANNRDPAGSDIAAIVLPPDATSHSDLCSAFFPDEVQYQDRVGVGTRAVNAAGRSAVHVAARGWVLEVALPNPTANTAVE